MRNEESTIKVLEMKWLINILFVLVVAPAFATTIVVIWTPTGAVLGADAKTRFGNGNPGRNACKIGVANNVIWAQSGILGTRNSPFYFRSILSEELSSHASIDVKIARIEQRISVTLTELVNTPLIKKSILSDPDKGQVQFVVIANENGINMMFMRTFMPERGGSGDAVIHIIRDGCNSASDCGDSQYVGLGFHAEADAAIRENPRIWENNPDWIVDSLIGLEIKKYPRDVGLPIAIIGLDSKGAHWISKGACDDKSR